MQFGQVECLIGIDIPHSSQESLVKQRGLEPPPTRAQPAIKQFGSERRLKGFRTKFTSNGFQAVREPYTAELASWENGHPVTARPEWAPEFTGETPLPSEEEIAAAKVAAKEDRPEVRELAIQIQMNNVELKLAKNDLLPNLAIEGGPVTGAIYWVGGFSYRVGALFSIPLFNREARGKVAHAEAQQERLTYELWHAEQKVSFDVDNWVSAIVRARDRVRAATRSLSIGEDAGRGLT